MKRGLFLSVLVFCTVLASSAYAGRSTEALTVLPISVGFIGFAETKKLCGSDTPPAWCPEHLLASHAVKQVADTEAVYGKRDVNTMASMLSKEELAKRARIRKSKLIHGYRINKM